LVSRRVGFCPYFFHHALCNLQPILQPLDAGGASSIGTL
jgi:hypothetical protein